MPGNLKRWTTRPTFWSSHSTRILWVATRPISSVGSGVGDGYIIRCRPIDFFSISSKKRTSVLLNWKRNFVDKLRLRNILAEYTEDQAGDMLRGAIAPFFITKNKLLFKT